MVIPIVAGLAAAVVAWFFELQIRDIIDRSPWMIPILAAISVTGLLFWLM